MKFGIDINSIYFKQYFTIKILISILYLKVFHIILYFIFISILYIK